MMIDISRPVSPATAVWPMDRPVTWSWTARLEGGDSVNVGAMALSMHTGTHVDAPYHVTEDGSTIDELPLSVFIGQAEVVEVESEGEIRPEHVSQVQTSRVLFKTSASTLPADTWPASISPIHPDTVTSLQARDVVLVGTDAPSVDPLDSTSLPAHHALIDAGIVNMEGLTLSEVEPGRYSLIALPLDVQGADAAPVRAVLGSADLLQGDS